MNITIKQVLDKDGAFSHLELHQNGNYIEISLANTDLQVQPSNYKWANLKKQIDALLPMKESLTSATGSYTVSPDRELVPND